MMRCGKLRQKSSRARRETKGRMKSERGFKRARQKGVIILQSMARLVYGRVCCSFILVSQLPLFTQTARGRSAVVSTTGAKVRRTMYHARQVPSGPCNPVATYVKFAVGGRKQIVMEIWWKLPPLEW